MFELVKMNKKIRIAEAKTDLARLELAERTLISALERTRLIDRDYDEDQWIMNGQFDVSSPGGIDYDHNKMLESAYNFWVKNLFARAIIGNLTKFVLGKGPIIHPVSKNGKVKDAWDEFVLLNKWELKQKEAVRRTFRDGELFIRKFKNSAGPLILRFLRANNIRNPRDDSDKNSDENVTFGIGTNPEDVEDVKTYYYCDAEGKLIEAIPAADIIHIKILTDSDVKRGMSFLLHSMSMLKKYEGWLDDRVVLNQVRSAIALIKKIEGNANTVESLRNAQQTERKDADRNRQKALKRGTVITATKGIDYQMLSPKINAPDVKDDGRAMLLAVAAGSGMPEMVVTADYSNANYSSSMVAQNPFVREIEDWQDFFKVYDKIIFADVIAHAIEFSSVPKNESVKCTVEYPPLILADIKKNNEAREIQHRNKILSKKTWQEKEGLEPEVEERNMEDEMGKDIYKQPFNMPLNPINQFGSTEEDIEE